MEVGNKSLSSFVFLFFLEGEGFVCINNGDSGSFSLLFLVFFRNSTAQSVILFLGGVD